MCERINALSHVERVLCTLTIDCVSRIEMPAIRKPYPSDVRDEEWPLVAPYLTLMEEGAP